MVAVNEVKTDWTISCPHKQFTRTGLWESEHIITWRILGSLLFIFFLLRTLAVGSYFAKYYVRERIPSGLPVALEPSHWCVHFLMPWVNTPNCFRDEHYERNQTDNHNQVSGIGAHKKNEAAIHFSSILILWSTSRISTVQWWDAFDSQLKKRTESACDSICLSRASWWFLWCRRTT